MNRSVFHGGVNTANPAMLRCWEELKPSPHSFKENMKPQRKTAPNTRNHSQLFMSDNSLDFCRFFGRPAYFPE